MLSPDNNYLFIATTTITKAIGTAGVMVAECDMITAV